MRDRLEHVAIAIILLAWAAVVVIAAVQMSHLGFWRMVLAVLGAILCGLGLGVLLIWVTRHE